VTVLDASALLAFLKDEPGADVVRKLLDEGASCASINWSEVVQKLRFAGADWTLAAALLDSWSLTVEPVTRGDAEWAAERWKRSENLSLADRLCLALGARLDVEVYTADREWGGFERVRLIR